jgi:hypothetical protein
MPNECINHLTIISLSESDISKIMESDIKILNVTIDKIAKKGIRFHFKTEWKPNYQWLELLRNKYPSIWIKNDWISEDGNAGVWIGHKKNIKLVEWDDLSIEDEYYYFNCI